MEHKEQWYTFGTFYCTSTARSLPGQNRVGVHYYPPPLSQSHVPLIIFKMGSQSRRWCFTCNNWTQESLVTVDSLLSDDELVLYGCYGYETSSSGTPHLQGFVVFRHAVRFNRITAALPGAHVEACRGTSQQARNYCLKDGHPDNKEYGLFPGNAGQRNDLLALREWGQLFIDEHGRPPTQRELYREQFVGAIKYPRLCEGFEALAPHPVIQEGELRIWQAELEQELLEDADDRSVMFYVDEEGNKGKSWFIRYMVSKYPDTVKVMAPGKLADMAQEVDPNKHIYLFNVARGQMEYMQYAILEALKDRMVKNTKYRGGDRFFRKKVHVVVMCNEEPDRSKMSFDRYDMRAI